MASPTRFSRFSKRSPRPSSSVLPPISSLPRKEEQYRLLCKVQASTLTDENICCRQALKTTPTVNKTTKKFNNDFVTMTMPHHVIDPVQLDRLKRCSRTFSRIIQNCPKYSSTLTEIKKVYDSYLNYVLLSFENEREPAVVKRSVSSHDRSRDKDELLKQISSLERDAIALLRENERLEKTLSEEREVMRLELPPMTEDTPSSTRAESSEGKLEFADHVTHLQQQILDHRFEADKFLCQRSDQVPLQVCQKLEQCIRSTELSIQRLKKQNSILVSYVEEMEEKLQRYFHALKTPRFEIEHLLRQLQAKASENN